MDGAARQQYLSSQVFTATPERLHLMLIDGAIRFARQLREALAAGDYEWASTIGERLRDVLAEILLCIEQSGNAAARRLRSIYVFLIRESADAQVRRQGEKLDGVLRVLEIERDTWSQLCDKLAPHQFRRDGEHPATGEPALGATETPVDTPADSPIEPFSMQA